MLLFERTTDAALIRRVFTHEAIWPHITDDGSRRAADFNPSLPPSFWYVRVSDGDELLGLFLLTPQNSATYEIHTCLLPCAWGKRAAEAALGIVEWFFEQVPACHRIVTSVPNYNRLALRFAKRGGMTEYGENPASFRKGGKLFSQILLGLSRPQGQHSCQQQP